LSTLSIIFFSAFILEYSFQSQLNSLALILNQSLKLLFSFFYNSGYIEFFFSKSSLPSSIFATSSSSVSFPGMLSLDFLGQRDDLFLVGRYITHKA